jgi:hypothetical protein
VGKEKSQSREFTVISESWDHREYPESFQEYIQKSGIRMTPRKVSSRRINLEGNTHAQESNASQLPV